MIVSHISATLSSSCWLLVAILIAAQLVSLTEQANEQHPVQHNHRHHPTRTNRPQINRAQVARATVLKDAYNEDYSFVVRIRTTYNHSSSITCNGVVMEPDLVMTDITCIKYQGMANIDARFVQVIAGESPNEIQLDVKQIYINKVDPKDPGTELAVLRLSKEIQADPQCKILIKPERNQPFEADTPVRVVGFTISGQEMKENRTQLVKRDNANYLYTLSSELCEGPGNFLLRGAPLLRMVDCKHYQVIGILAKSEEIVEGLSGPRRQQDFYVKIASQMKWFDQVSSMSVLSAKRGQPGIGESTVVTTTVEQDEEREVARARLGN